MSLLRSWDVGGARIPARRAGLVIDLAQLPLRPLVAALTRPRWEGTENIPEAGAVIACGNHLSALDPLAYGHLLQASGVAPRFLAKESLFRVPGLGALLRAARQIPVLRGTSRSRDALSTGAPLLPIASWGGRGLWPVGSPLPRPAPGRRVRMLVGAPYTVAAAEGETEHEAALRVTEDLMARIAALLGQLRGLTPPAELHDPRGDEHRPEIGRPQPGFRAPEEPPR